METEDFTMSFKTQIEVRRIGSENVKSASGKANINWFIEFTGTTKEGPDGIRFAVPQQTMNLELEAFNDDTDQNEEWTEYLRIENVTQVKVQGPTSDYANQDIFKLLSQGLKPKSLEIWRDEITLQF